MAGNVTRFAFLNARVSMMAGRLLGEEALQALLVAPLGEHRELLRRAGLTRIEPDAAVDAAVLERGISALLLEDVSRLIRPSSGAERELLVYWAHRFELANLKTIIRGRFHKREAQTIKQELIHLGEHRSLNVDALLAAEDLAELLRHLEGHSHYASIARQARRVLEERHELFTLEASIDREYYAGLAERAGKVQGGGRGLLRELVDVLIDRVNLIWLLRFRFAYGLQPAEAYYLLVPAGGRLTRSRMLALAQLEGWEQIRAQLPEPMRSWVGEAEAIPEVHRRLKRQALRRAMEILTETSFNFARAFAYLLLREDDLRRATAILKGRALNLPPSQIAQAANLAPESAPARREPDERRAGIST